VTEQEPLPDSDALRAVLVAERESTVAQIEELTRDFDGMVAAVTSVATDDEHDPEGATIAFERAQVAALLRQAGSRIEEIDFALERLSEGTYGQCERCGQPIGAARLAARPASRTCITCASSRAR
jgi:RNA polymerase-binding transcription factor DksA